MVMGNMSDKIFGFIMICVVVSLPVGGFYLGSASEKWRLDHYTRLSDNYQKSQASTDRLIQTLEDIQAKHCVWNKDEVNEQAL